MDRRIALVCPLVLALACSGDEDPKRNGNNGDGSGDGDSGIGGDGDSFNPDPDGDGICEEQGLIPRRVTPDMLIVLDRSRSMVDQSNGGPPPPGGNVDRWGNSVAGINTITDRFEELIRFGLMTFPGGNGDVGSRDECSAGDMRVDVDLNTSSEIAQTLAETNPGGRTPTSRTLENVVEEFDAQVLDPDVTQVARYVVLVTDGAPNCMGNGGWGGNDEEGAVEATVAAIETLAQAGIPTYVLGYDTKDDSELSSALDMMARAGDTGAQAHHPIENTESLLAVFEEIAGGAVSCDFLLNTKPDDPSFISVTLNGEPLKLDDPNGWSLGADGRRVTVRGSACEQLKTNLDDEDFLEVTVQCAPVVF